MGFKDNPVVYLTRKSWEYSNGNRKTVVLFFAMFIFANSMSLLEPLVIAKVLNIVQEEGINQGNLLSIVLYLSIFIGITIVFWAFHGPARVLEETNGFVVRANYKKYLLDGVMSLKPEWHAEHHSGDTIDKIEKATNALFNYATEMSVIIETVILFIGSYIALMFFNIHASYIVLFTVVITITLILRFDRVLIGQYRELFRAENRISAKIYDIISNITTVIILRVEKLVSKSMFKQIMNPYELYIKNNKINEGKWFFVSLAGSFMLVSVIASFIYFNFKNNEVILIGTIFALYSYVDRINNLFFRFTHKYGDLVRKRASVANAEEITKDFRKIKRTRTDLLDYKWNELKIEGLDFSYNRRRSGELHLDNISLVKKRGQKIAFIGESGSGKTTMLKLIRQLYDPQRLNLYLDNKKLKNGFSDISSEIALIPQEPEIFSTTIKDNITLGIPHSIDYVRKYTDMARFSNVVTKLPKKLNSHIDEKGVNLSGGEKQRLALARGLMACEDKEIILLDEPTSSVDFKNEIEIHKNIFKEFKKKTMISSIHRLHLLNLFDNVFFFKNGKLIAEGTFNELLRNSNEFKKMWEKYNKSKEGKLR